MWFAIGKAIFDNPVARWIGVIVGIALGLRAAEAWVRSDQDNRRRRQDENRRRAEILQRREQAAATQDRANEIRNSNAGREHPFDSMSDASRRVIFSNQ